jgi:hypothetical protein
MPEFFNVLKYVSEISQRQTRISNSNLFYVPRAKTEYYKRAFSVSGSNAWTVCKNEDVRNSTSVECFKSKYLSHYHQ